jgi:hypothetical protein
MFIFISLYVRYTESGQKSAYRILSLYASYIMDNDIKIKDINLTKFPYIKIKLILDRQYDVILKGFTQDKQINFDYRLSSNCFKSTLCTLNDNTYIKGRISGHKNSIFITGEGETLDGNITYTLKKEKRQYKDVNILLKDINSSKLFALLGEKSIFKTKVDAHITSNHIKDDSHMFDINITSKEIQLHITQGNYQSNKDTAKAKYRLYTPDLSLLKRDILTNSHKALNVKGELTYRDKTIKILGITEDFDGALFFKYEHNKTKMILHNISAKKLMKTFNIHPFIDANISGEGLYNLTTKQMDFKASLGRVRLLTSALKNEVFDTNSFDIHLKNSTFHANLKLTNKQTHLIFTDMVFKDIFTLSTNIDFKTPKQTIKGKVSFNSNIKNSKNHSIYFDGAYQIVPLKINANMKIKNKTIFFDSHVKLASSDININDGFYDTDTNISKASYTFSTKDLKALTPILGEYLGSFYARGTILYYEDTLQIRGLSNSFGGMVDFLYKQNMLYIDLENVLLSRLMHLFSYPQMLQAQVNGNINYDYTKEQLLIRTDLNDTIFLKSDITNTIFKKSGINLLQEVFSHSKLFAIFQHNILAGDLILKNRHGHLFVKNTQINTKKNTVNAHFDLHMQGQEFSGSVYGTLHDPKVKLNMEKLIRYQMDKQLDSVIGKGNRKLMESMPMGGAAKDVATDMGAGIMEMFF